MNPEEIALKFADSRPGMQLVNFFEVGLPFWKLRVVATLMERRPIQPIAEFAMKCIEAGLVSAADISGFLGLDERLSVATLSDLLFEGLIRTVGPSQYGLTDQGRVVLQDCEMTAAKQEELLVYYDGLTHETLFLADTDLASPKSVRERGIKEWPAWPADPPSVEEVDLLRVRAAWQAKDLHRKKKKEIISVDSIVGKRIRLYLEAVALVFQSPDPSERPQVAFAIDHHKLSDEHEAAFAAASGERKHNLLMSLRATPFSEVRPVVGGKRIDDANRPEVVDAVSRVEEARAQLQAAERQTQRVTADPSRTAQLQAEVDRLRGQLAAAEAALTPYANRRLPVHEHPLMLRRALLEASERVMIVSPWIKAAVVDMDFLQLVKSALERGVEITIIYGIGGRDGDGDYLAIRALEGLRSHGDLRMARLGNTHAKVLIKDHDWMVVTSFNWLSFRGDPNKPIRDERGIYCCDPVEVDGQYDDYTRMIAER